MSRMSNSYERVACAYCYFHINGDSRNRSNLIQLLNCCWTLVVVCGLLSFLNVDCATYIFTYFQKIEIDNEIQYFIGMFSGIFGGSIVLLADKLFYGQTKWNPSSFAVSVIEFFTVFLLIYVVGLVIVDFHVKSLKKRKKREG